MIQLKVERAGAELVRSVRRYLPKLTGLLLVMVTLALLAAFGGHAWAQDAAATAAKAPAEPVPAAFELNTGSTAWILASSALVLFMTPGLAFFYGGLVRSKNVLNTLLMSYGAMAMLAVVWALVGYSIAFGNNGSPWWGGLDWIGLPDVKSLFTDGYPAAVDAAGKYVLLNDAPIRLFANVPHGAFMVFQMMFFIITPALISGSLVERLKFSSYLLYIVLWGLLVYCPVAHWVWQPAGWIFSKGAMDFAGGAVVHVNAGFAALAGVLVLGPRKGYGARPLIPHSLPLCLLGVGMLWFGWYGFNAGSAGAADGLATLAFVNTTLGAAAAMAVWMFAELFTRKEMTALGAGTGAVAGLVGITPACGFVNPMGAIAVGAITSIVCFMSANLRAKSKLDDSLDAFAVHGVGGFTGAVLTGVFATESVKMLNAGVVQGGVGTAVNQFICTATVAIYTFGMSFLIMSAIKALGGVRVSDEAEDRGLDISLHGEEAYASEGAA